MGELHEPVDEVAQQRRERRLRTLGVVGAVAAIATVALVALGGGAVGLGEETLTLVTYLGFPVTVASVMVGVAWARRRAQRRRSEALIGFDLDLAELRYDPAKLERLRSKVTSVGLMRMMVDDGGSRSDTSSPRHASFLFLADGETLDLDLHADAGRIEDGAFWLAEQLRVPVVDSRYGGTETYPWDRLPGRDAPAQAEAMSDDSTWLVAEAEETAPGRPGSLSTASDEDQQRRRRAAGARQRERIR